jgi:2-polyprenyl-6-methoxyphenol hydroxylase-like FAD-dependent oxidoreductase
MVQVTVIGGGVAGLGSALTFARRGHHVTVVERDDTPMPASADEAFEWDRRGAPQVRHSHAFLARLTTILRRDHPDVYADLLAEGATELRFGDDLAPTITNFAPQPDDADLVMLACRRTTFEWVVRRAAIAEGRVTFRTGVGVDGLLSGDAVSGDTTAGTIAAAATGGDMSHVPHVPHVTGVRLADGSTLAADLVVVAAGRRGALPEWLAALGVPAIVEEVEDTGIVYFSRFYRLRVGADVPPRAGAIGGDLGYLKYGVFVGDNRTFSVTLATPTDDVELRRTLAQPAVFDACARQLTVAAPWLDGRAEPITPDVHVMAGLLNRWRDLVVDGQPVVTGAIAIGDTVLCTNPLYGRGCSTAFWGAGLAADALDAHPADPRALVVAYDAALRAEIRPWYRATVHQDGEARRVATMLLAGEDPDGDPSDSAAFMRGVFRDGLVPALRLDAVVLRAFVRSFNLLSAPDAMMTDPDVQARVLQVWQDRDTRPPEAPLGPRTRDDLLATLHA